MKSTYYDRSGAKHLDGSVVFGNDADRASEDEVAAVIETAWKCQLRRFGALSPVDWYAVRMERLAGVVELKTRSHVKAQYPTVFLNVRKWMALSMAADGLGVPAIFVVRFTDGIYWTSLSQIDPRGPNGYVPIGGCSRRVKADNDREPVIEVPVKALKLLVGDVESAKPGIMVRDIIQADPCSVGAPRES